MEVRKRRKRRQYREGRVSTAPYKVKKSKAPGENGIENEAWRLMPRDWRSIYGNDK